MSFYKKPRSRSSTKSFLIFGHILVPKVSLKSLNLANLIAVKAYTEHECRKIFVLEQTKCFGAS